MAKRDDLNQPLIDNQHDIEKNTQGESDKIYLSNITGRNELHLSIRKGFITKVFGIVSCQLLLTILFCSLSMISESFLRFQLQNIWLLYVCLIGTIIIMIVLLYKDSLLRKVPTNYIILFSFTILESYIVGLLCGVSDPKIVFMAAFMTFAIILGLTIYSFTTKEDITLKGATLFMFGLALFLLSIFVLFTSNPFFYILLSCIWIILLGFYIIYDLQLIIGNGSLKLTTDDYIIASLLLYVDIISLFVKILDILTRLFRR